MTLSSLRALLPMRAAIILRWPTSPATLATCKPCKATGITMAISNSAASTSASVKAERDDLAADGRFNIILQMGWRFRDPDLHAVSLTQVDAGRAGVADKAVGLEPDFGHSTEMRGGLRPIVGMRQRGRRGREHNLHAGIDFILLRLGRRFRVTG